VSGAAERPSGYTIQEIWQLLGQLGGISDDVVLVGGQALAFWAHYYRAKLPGDLLPYVTLDVDFLGTSAHAKAFADKLAGATLYLPSLDDHTPSSGRVVARNVFGRTLEVDFLHSMAGLSESEVRRNAVEIKDTRGDLLVRVMHPLYCLESRIKNLVLLPSKRDRFGIAQAQLAVRVMRLHIAHVLDEADGTRKALRLVERIGELALSEPGKRCFLEYRVDLLKAVPAKSISAPEFEQRRWPQLRRQISEQRRTLRALIERASRTPVRARSRAKRQR
jgi:hypothetical protein